MWLWKIEKEMIECFFQILDIQRVPRMTQSSFPGLDKNMLMAAGSALRGIRLSTQAVFCLPRYHAARAIGILSSFLFVFLVL
jgi:hypothetical protein